MRNIFKRFFQSPDAASDLVNNSSSKLNITNKPTHIAVVMDGNGRWANSRGLTRIAGHKKGADAVKALLRGCVQQEIPYLSIFAFSSENWNRPDAEVSALMDLLQDALQTQITKLNENGIRIQFIGDLSKFNESIQSLAMKAEAATKHNSKLVFNVAINYGGRWDITQACQQIAAKLSNGQITSEQIDDQMISAHLSTSEIPDPDLFIRTSGEHRISNFFLWQSAYTEMYFTDTLWPDFDQHSFNQALISYAQRDRRFGGAADQIDIENNQKSYTEQGD